MLAKTKSKSKSKSLIKTKIQRQTTARKIKNHKIKSKTKIVTRTTNSDNVNSDVQFNIHQHSYNNNHQLNHHIIDLNNQIMPTSSTPRVSVEVANHINLDSNIENSDSDTNEVVVHVVRKVKNTRKY